MLSTAAVNAQENFLTDPVTPYPPGCLTNTEAMDLIPGRETVITTGRVSFTSWALGVPDGDFLEVDVSLIRRGCAEPERSVLIVELDVIDDGDETPHAIRMPYFRADRFGVMHDIRGVAEPNSWGLHSSGDWLGEGQSIRLFLDGPDMAHPDFDPERALTPEEYNGDWVLEIYEPLWTAYRIDVPEYRDQLRPDAFVLNGRLSGIWWVPDAPDQGIYLGFHERANAETGVVFFSWNTFGPDGENLWFSGTGHYAMGDESVEIDMVWVTDGEFMGSTPASRTSAGTVTLTANSCNDLTFTFDVDYPGLEPGSRRLVRPFSLETQGYACRDRQARQDALLSP
jgi:hypothetical protein